MSTFRVWNACSPHLSRSIKRVVKAIRDYAPEGVVFVSDPNEADIQIVHLVGKGELAQIKAKHVVLWQYCWQTSDVPDWRALWRRCDIVVSYLDLPAGNLLRLPLGVDPEVFYPDLEGLDGARYGLIGIGYVAETEALREGYEACQSLGLLFAHVGCDFSWGGVYRHFENISDDLLRSLYNRSRFALATRRVEGFELPALEAAACGTRPICFDTPGYRRWFNDFALFIPEDDRVRDSLLSILLSQSKASRLTSEERKSVVSRYGWETVMRRFWSEVYGRYAK